MRAIEHAGTFIGADILDGLGIVGTGAVGDTHTGGVKVGKGFLPGVGSEQSEPFDEAPFEAGLQRMIVCRAARLEDRDAAERGIPEVLLEGGRLRRERIGLVIVETAGEARTLRAMA